VQHRHPRLDSINERVLDFVCLVIDPFVSSIPARPGMRRIQDQLVGSSGGIGANLEEAPAASSRKEFIRFCEIDLRESRDQSLCRSLLGEGLQIARIIAAIIVNTKNNSDDD
jgi:hypothetical protein